MQLDKKAIDRLLNLSDSQLRLVVKKIAGSAGVDAATLNLDAKSLAGLRAALSMATDADISKFSALIAEFKRAKKES